LLILRFSALGDVAMTAPVVRAYAAAYPKILFTMVSSPLPAPLFQGISNLRFEAVNTNAYKGLGGTIRLFRRLRKLQPDLLLDLHQVLRTHILRVLFRLGGLSVFAVHKGRRQKRRLTRAKRKCLHPLPSMISRYEAVFVQAGFAPLHIDRAPLVGTIPIPKPPENSRRRVGIAPFAKHPSKFWPLEKTEELVRRLSLSGHYELFLLGSRQEADILSNWAGRYADTRCIADVHNFAQELNIIGSFDLLVSMDSANMHLASFKGVPVVSIWGGTHPYAGFYGWRQDPQQAVQSDLTCRPCSVFGNKSCRQGSLDCLQSISVDTVFWKIERNFAP